ncbi:MAG: TPM domain-containing protein [Verrucomicrobia bacterium]|nr:TPM domain-containing protein [Verrucomicrobiota bacterium]
MNCPHCSSLITPAQPVCTQCGFSATAIRGYLGADWVKLARITDNAQLLSLKHTRHLETVLDDFERRFPQCFMAAYIGALPETLTLPDLGFWLINHGAFHTHQVSRRNDFGIVLMIDPVRQQACFTLGYALESVLVEKTLTTLLKKLQGPLSKGAFATAIESAVSLIDQELLTAARSEPRQLEQAPSSIGDASDLGLHTLRPPSRPLLHAPKAP